MPTRPSSAAARHEGAGSGIAIEDDFAATRAAVIVIGAAAATLLFQLGASVG